MPSELTIGFRFLLKEGRQEEDGERGKESGEKIKGKIRGAKQRPSPLLGYIV